MKKLLLPLAILASVSAANANFYVGLKTEAGVQADPVLSGSDVVVADLFNPLKPAIALAEEGKELTQDFIKNIHTRQELYLGGNITNFFAVEGVAGLTEIPALAMSYVKNESVKPFNFDAGLRGKLFYAMEKSTVYLKTGLQANFGLNLAQDSKKLKLGLIPNASVGVAFHSFKHANILFDVNYGSVVNFVKNDSKTQIESKPFLGVGLGLEFTFGSATNSNNKYYY